MSAPASLPGTAGEPPIPAEVARRAVEWLVELQADDAPAALREQWRQWRAAHPDHERAWQRIETVNDRLHPLSGQGNAALARAALLRPGSPARRRAIGSLVALLFAGGGAWMLRERTQPRRWLADQRTAIGERRRLSLDDGSTVQLNTGTAVDVDFGTVERRLRLIEGEVLVAAAVDAAARPFVVETDAGTVQALGTRFLLRRYPDRIGVAAYDGAVRIRARAAGHAQDLPAGRQLHFNAAGPGTDEALDPDRDAWIDGLLVARSMALADFLAELGRYTAHSLSCEPAIAALRVSGTYPVDDVDGAIEAVAGVLSLRSERVPGLPLLRASGIRLHPAGSP